jgi:hypothetical protein
MLIEKEILGAKSFNGGVKGVVIEEDSAEDGPLGFEIIGKGLFEDGVSGH